MYTTTLYSLLFIKSSFAMRRVRKVREELKIKSPPTPNPTNDETKSTTAALTTAKIKIVTPGI
jgi:hypothetical protein